MQSKEEIQQQCAAWASTLPVGYQATDANVALIAADIQKNESGVYTVETLNRSTNRVSKDARWTWAAPARVKSPDEIAYGVVAAENPLDARKLEHWYDTIQNVLDKEYRWHDMRSLFIAMRGRDMTRENLIWAMDYIGGGGRNSGGALHLVPRSQPKSESGRRHAADGEGFLGKNVNQSALGKNHELREAQEKNNPNPTVIKAGQNEAYKNEARAVQGNNHGETEQIQKVFVMAGADIDWSGTLTARRELQNRLNVRRQQGH